MAFYLVHATSKIQKVTVAGGVSDLTLPTGVTMSTTKHTRFAVLNGSVFAVYGPTKNVRIRPSDMATRPLSLVAPSTVPTVAAGAAGVLTGEYFYKVSFAERTSGVLTSESPLSSATTTITLAAQKGSLTSIPVSTDDGVTDRRLYRTTTGGSASGTFFPLAYIADNTTTTYTDNTADASLGDTAADTDLGNPAGTTTADYLPLLVAWKDRLWAVWSTDLDSVYYSGINKWYAWSATNYLTVAPKEGATTGITAFLPRRDELGVAKRRSLSKIVGASSDSYAAVDVIRGIGVIAPESVVIIRDAAYFLSEDGPYVWDASGAKPLALERVAAWFQTDDYFNRARFAYAFGVWNQQDDTYEVHLAAATSGVEDRWVAYDLQRGRWSGPHKTDAFTPGVAQMLDDHNNQAILVRAGSDGYLYRCHDATFLDGATAIDFSVTTGYHSGGVPGLEKYWGELTVLSGPQAAGTLTITPYVGSQSATAQATISHDLTLDRVRHRRLGVGRLAKLTFSHSTASQGCEIQGYEIVPVSVVGVR